MQWVSIRHTLFFQEGPLGQEGDAYARMAKPVPCGMGVQVSRGHHTKVPAKSLLRETAEADWCDPAGVVLSKGSGIAGRVFDKPKFMYQEIQSHPGYALDTSRQYGNNKTFFIACDDLYLLSVLNSPLTWWHN